jgi:hypothetical protein
MTLRKQEDTGSWRSHSLENSVWKKLLTCRETDKYLTWLKIPIHNLLKKRKINTREEVLGRTNRLLSLIRHGSHWKRRIQQLFSCCVCIRYRVNVSIEPLPSNDKGISLQRSCLATVGGIFTGMLSSNHTRIFTETFPSNDRGDTQTHTATWSHKPT